MVTAGGSWTYIPSWDGKHSSFDSYQEEVLLVFSGTQDEHKKHLGPKLIGAQPMNSEHRKFAMRLSRRPPPQEEADDGDISSIQQDEEEPLPPDPVTPSPAQAAAAAPRPRARATVVGQSTTEECRVPKALQQELGAPSMIPATTMGRWGALYLLISLRNSLASQETTEVGQAIEQYFYSMKRHRGETMSYFKEREAASYAKLEATFAIMCPERFFFFELFHVLEGGIAYCCSQFCLRSWRKSRMVQ